MRSGAQLLCLVKQYAGKHLGPRREHAELAHHGGAVEVGAHEGDLAVLSPVHLPDPQLQVQVYVRSAVM